MSDGGQFPEGFVWGAATSSYQIEGAVREDGRGPSIWDTFSHTPGKTRGGDTGDVADDHYHRWHQDVMLMRDLGLQAYRFSVAWPRVIPDGGRQVNEAGLDFYDRLVDGLLESDIEPWLTLYHWDLPQALADRGGLTNSEVAGAFVTYTEAVARRLGDRVKRWITINEPWVAGIMGYWWGVHAPGETSREAGLAASHNLLRMHGMAVEVLRGMVPDVKAGITLNLTPVYPIRDTEEDREAARLKDGEQNRWFLDPVFRGGYPEDMVREYGDDVPEIADGDMALISRPTDFLGINYYNPTYVSADEDAPQPDGERTEMGWLVEPEGLKDILTWMHEEYGPQEIAITENGAAYDDPAPVDDRVHDPKRIAYFHAHLLAAKEAIDAGVPLRAYFAWSLMDNFEWAEGYSKRFGIVHVDYSTQERTLKDSARWYANVIEANAVLGEDVID
ncbi:MAG TPA: GH1 family beta-glucosidase [Thermomicrobiales bacterium]|nr:GH1 family beta-glucosidase [Thermomicrobiales bacterium]